MSVNSFQDQQQTPVNPKQDYLTYPSTQLRTNEMYWKLNSGLS